MKIVSLAPSNTEILYALGAQDSIIATTRFCDYPAAAISTQKISGWSDVDVKKVAALKPDIVLTSSIVQAKTAQALREAGINVTHIDPKTIGEVIETFIKIGHSVNRAATGRELAYNVRDKLATMSKGCNYGKKIYIEEWHKPPTASANWVPDLLTLLGCKAITRSGIISREVTTKQVAQFDPDAIVLSWCGFGTKADANQLLEREGWEGLRAVQNNNVFIVDDSFLNRPGPRLVEGLRVLKEIASRC